MNRPTKKDLEEVNLLFLEASGEHTDKTALEIIKDEIEENQQAKLCYDLFEKMVQTKQYDRASKLSNVLYYKFNIDVTA